MAAKINAAALVKKIPASLGELSDLSAKSEVADALVTAGILPVLVIALKSDHNDIVQKAATVVKNIAKYDPSTESDDSRTDAVFCASVVPLLVNLLAHKSHGIVVPCTIALGNIAFSSDVRSDAVVAMGAVPKLLTLCDHSRDDVQQAAISTLANICSGSDDRRIATRASVLLQNGAVPKLSRLLSSRSSEMKISAVKALRCVGYVEDSREQNAKELIPVMLAIFNKCGTSESDNLLKTVLISTMMSLLADSRASCALFAEAGGVSAIIKTMTTKNVSANLLTACTSILQAVAIEKETFREVAGQQKVLAKIFPLLMHADETVRQEVLNFLLGLSILDDSLKVFLVEAGAIQSVAQLLSLPGLRESLVTTSLHVIEQLTTPRIHSSHAQVLSGIVAHSPLIASLFNLISSEAEGRRLVVTCIMRNLCCVCDANIRALLIQQDVCDLCLAMLKAEDAELHLPSLETLAYLCDPLPEEGAAQMDATRTEIVNGVLPMTKGLLMNKKLCTAFAWLLENIIKYGEAHAALFADSGLVQTLIPLLSSEDESIVFAAISTIMALCLENSPRRKLLYDLGGAPKVALLLASDSERCRVRAAECLVLLCSGGDSGVILRKRLLEKNIIPNLAGPLALAENEFLPHIALFFWILIREGGEYQKAAVAAGAIPMLTRFLSVPNEVANWRAAKALGSLLEDYSCLYGVVAAGAVPIVVVMLDSENEDCQRAAIECMSKLSFSNHIEAAEEAGVVPRLISLLSSRTLETRLDVIAALAAIRTTQNTSLINNSLLSVMHSADHPSVALAAAEALLSAEALPPNLLHSAARKLVKLLQSAPDECRSIVRSIAQSVNSSDKGDAFVEAGLINLLPILLKSTDNFVRIWSSIAVRNLVVDSEERSKAVVESGVGPCLISMLSSEDMHCQLAALFTIPSLVYNGVDVAIVLGDKNVVQQVIALLQSNVDEVLVGACQTLQYIARNDRARDELIASGCAAALIKLFASESVSVVCEAALAVAALVSSDKDAAHAKAIVDEGAVPALVAALKSRRSSKVTSSTAFALSTLTERSYQASNAAVDFGALSVLDSMLDSQSFGMQELGADVLGTLFQNQDAERRAKALLARNSMHKILVLLDSSSAMVRQVAALTMWHASRTEAGAIGLLNVFSSFMTVYSKYVSDSALQLSLLQSFANLTRFADAEIRQTMKESGATILEVARTTLPQCLATDLDLAVDCFTILVNLTTAIDTPCPLEYITTLAELLQRVHEQITKDDDFLAWAVVQPATVLSYGDRNRELLLQNGIVPQLYRLFKVSSERVQVYILKTLANISFAGNVCDQAPELLSKLSAIVGPPSAVADAAIIIHHTSARARLQPMSSSFAQTLSKRVLLTSMESQHTFGKWLRDHLQQLGFTVLFPDLRALTTYGLNELQSAIDQTGAVVIVVDPAMIRSEAHNIFVDMCQGMHKLVIPVKVQTDFQMQGWLKSICGDEHVLCFEDGKPNALALDILANALNSKKPRPQAHKASLTSISTKSSEVTVERTGSNKQ